MQENISLNLHIKNLFGDLISRKDITEIVINKFGEIWIEDEQGFLQGTKEQCERITKANCEAFTNALASATNQQHNTKNPILGATLPSGERVQIITPPACDENQYSITIRKPSSFELSIGEFKKNGYFDEIVIGEQVSDYDVKQCKLLDEKRYDEFLTNAVATGHYNMVIAGATGSGKTTLMKALTNYIPSSERLLTIEDVRELYLSHPNMVNMLYPSENTGTVTATILLKSSLRMKPNRILLAELRGGEAFDYLNVISSGHGGSITSVHAGNKEETLQRLTLMTLQNPTGATLPYSTVRQLIEDTIDIVVHVGRINGRRCITQIYWNNYEQIKRKI